MGGWERLGAGGTGGDGGECAPGVQSEDGNERGRGLGGKTTTERTPLNGLGLGDGGVCGWEEGEAGSYEWGLARARAKACKAQCALMARA